MYIRSNYDSVNMCGSEKNSGFWKRLKQKALNVIPESTFNDDGKIRNWEKINDRITRPVENRLIMGATALLTQPAIDYYNHKVDEETREVSKNRTIAKILAGTTVGILVRGSSYKMVEKMTDITKKKAEKTKYSRALLPPKDFINLVRNPENLKKYRNGLSTVLALMAMCVTNFVLDAPLTVFLTNYFNAKRAEKMKKSDEGRCVDG